jgi:hypothetical protein
MPSCAVVCIGKAKAVRGNGARLVSAPMLCSSRLPATVPFVPPKRHQRATRAGLEPAAEPPGEAGTVTATTNIGILTAEYVDTRQDEHEHRGQRCHPGCCTAEDEQREDRKQRDHNERQAH